MTLSLDFKVGPQTGNQGHRLPMASGRGIPYTRAA
jgi:hypothetical protein